MSLTLFIIVAIVFLALVGFGTRRIPGVAPHSNTIVGVLALLLALVLMVRTGLFHGLGL